MSRFCNPYNKATHPQLCPGLEVSRCFTASEQHQRRTVLGFTYYMSLTTSFVILLATISIALGQTLRGDIRLAPGYIDLTSCQQWCIGGLLGWDPATDYSSWARLSTCSTKTCICAPALQASTETLIRSCVRSLSRCARSQVEQDGAIQWVAGYCGWTPTPPSSITAPVSQGQICYLPLTSRNSPPLRPFQR